MEIVAGLSLKNLKPRVWDPTSPYYLPDLAAVMISYADFHQMPRRRDTAMEHGLHAALDIPRHVRIYLANGAFYFLSKGGETPREAYEAFVQQAGAAWYAIPQDYIPTPQMSDDEQRDCLRRTMAMNRQYRDDGFVPVVHISRQLDRYLEAFRSEEVLRDKQHVALGGIVPNLLRAPKAMDYDVVLDSVRRVRREMAGKQLHVFGLGGTATLHLATLFGIDSVDSSGWRNRAARGIVQLAGCGDRMVAPMGKWRGREPSAGEWTELAGCACPACTRFGAEGLKAEAIEGFCHRATHNLWTLLEEARAIETHMAAGDYASWYREHLRNTIFLPLIERTLTL